MFRQQFSASSKRTFKLYYFPVRGRAEFLRLILVHSGAQFEDVRVKKEEWRSLKPSIPMGLLPALLVDNSDYICQTAAIGRYLAKEFGIAGKDNLERAKADMFVDGTIDLMAKLFDMHKSRQNDADIQRVIENWTKFYDQTLKSFLEHFDKFLEENGTDWLVGDSVTWADFAVAEILSVLQDGFTADAIIGFPKLIEFKNRVFALPRVSEYIEKRVRIFA